jgi:acyl carrier protein
MTGGLAEAELARLARAGIAPLPVAAGLDLFDRALGSAEPVVIAAKWDNAGLRSTADQGVLPVVLRGLVRPARRTAVAVAAAEAEPANSGELSQRLASLSEAGGRKLLVGLVRSHVAAVLAFPSAESVAVDRAFRELGFDSLTSVELRNRLGRETRLRLPTTLAFDYPTVTELGEYLRRCLTPEAVSPEDLLRDALERVRELMPEHDDDVRTKLVAVLRGAIGRFGAGPPAPGLDPGIDVDTVSSASDEEIFALIDNES